MTQAFHSAWQPTRLVRVVESFDTSMGTTKIKTDATFCFIKALGNRQGPHALASEFVASSLAKWFGLTVPDFAIMPLDPESCFELPRGHRTQPGPAFVSRYMAGAVWKTSEAELLRIENKADITRLVVFDTWVRNCDRHPSDLTSRKPNYDNVFLASTRYPHTSRLIALDHTHCFDRNLAFSPRLARIEAIKDLGTYGLFPAFRPFIDSGQLNWCKAFLRSITAATIWNILDHIPPDWQVDAPARNALADQIFQRAAFIADRIESGWPHADAPPGGTGDQTCP